MSTSLLLIALLIAVSAFFAIAELSLAASRRMKLRQLADEGDARADKVLAVQEQPGHYFTVVQMGVNTVAILGGAVGEGALTPHFETALQMLLPAEQAQHVATVAFGLSFVSITSLFIVLADLVPKRLSMNEPERMALAVITPMLWLVAVLKPLAWAFSALTAALIRMMGRPAERDNTITHHDILALAEAGNEAGVVDDAEQQAIENIFELDTRRVESAMTTRERIVFFLQADDDALIRTRIAEDPHSTYLVCDGEIDQVTGYVDATDLFQRVLRDEAIDLRAPGLVKKVLIVPDRLTLSEVLTQFRQAHEDFAVIVNEYSLVVGVITLNDVMSTVMGSLVSSHDEEQIVRRDDGSFLADGITPIPDVQRALELDSLPHPGQYDTLAGFLMIMLRRIPKRTDQVVWEGWRFEVVDVDSHRVDQVMIARVAKTKAAAKD